MQRRIPNTLLRIFENWLSNCWICIKWNDVTSDFIQIKFRVRQGSVLSPQLFAVYLNDIVSQVSQRCFVVLYADDILIMAPSVCNLQRLARKCMPSGTRFIGHASQLSKVVLYTYRATLQC